VAESDEPDASNKEPSTPDPHGPHKNRQQPGNTPGGVSTMSGTTAITSFSAADATQLDTDLVIHRLPALNESSMEILNLLAPEDAQKVIATCREIKIPGSRAARKLRLQEGDFDIARQSYGNATPFINSRTVARALFGPEAIITDMEYRPDAVLCKANVASLLKKFMVHHRESEDSRITLSQMDQDFPEPFMVQGDSSNHWKETFSLALTLRIHLLIATFHVLRDQPDFDPWEDLSRLFFDGDVDSQVARTEGHLGETKARGWANSALSSDLLSESYQSTIRQHLTIVRSFIHSDGDDPVDLDGLEAQYPWNDLVKQVAAWSRLRVAELEERLSAQGGAKSLASALLNMESQTTNAEGTRAADEEGEGIDDGAAITLVGNQAAGEGGRTLLPAAEIVEPEVK
jgi:hypothetical protein